MRNVCSIAIVCSLALLWSAHAQESEPAPDVDAALAEAEAHIARGDYLSSIKAYRRAEELSPEPDLRYLMGLAASFNHIGAFKNAEDYARMAIELASTPASKAAAYNQLGLALFLGGQAEADDLVEAADAFYRVIDLTSGNVIIAFYNLGEVLARLGRDEEAVDALEHYVATSPDGPHAERARDLISDPSLARVRRIPHFTAITLDGRTLTDADLIGKITLIDFWGSWCGPCEDAIPHLRVLSRRGRGKPFLLLSISSDTDEKSLRAFLEEHKPDWPQVWDESRELEGLFRVKTYPAYFLVGPDGELLYSTTGWNERVDHELKTRLTEALRELEENN